KFQGMYATPFEGITELLKQLKKENKLLFVVSNKPDHLAKIIVEHYFPTTFDLIYGHQEHLPEKPNPYLIDLIVNKYQLNKEEVLFIGDSDVDYLTAKNGQVPF
ncbi:MAG: HAD-IA family hydrolase, partial [Bacilli bacterium]|nr:HAD-IA family hydrolase [Bacilli bacterium]